jgi:hypothetical protein
MASRTTSQPSIFPKARKKNFYPSSSRVTAPAPLHAIVILTIFASVREPLQVSPEAPAV